MTNDEYRTLLEKREETLLNKMDKNQAEARDLTDQNPAEAMERMVNLEGRDTLLQHNNADFLELTEIREALERLKAGTFGKCLECGLDLPEGRLQAIPWAKYCREDQEKQDRGGNQASGSLTM